MSELSISVNTVEFEGAMQRLRRGVRDGFIDKDYGLLLNQGRLLAERCQDFTPPRNFAQGKTAVARDLSVIFRPLAEKTFTDKGIKKIIRTDDRSAWNAISIRFHGSSGLQNTNAIGFSPEWHQKNRISRGRGRRGKGGNIGVVTLGPEGRAARVYMKTVQGRVGWAKAGWNAGILGLGGKVAGAWISRHGTDGGSLVNGTAAADPFVQVTNSTSWARYGSQGEGNRILHNAIQARSRDMESYFNRMMKLAADRAQKAA